MYKLSVLKFFIKRCGMKKVWNLSDYDKKILRILFENREGLRAKTLKKLLGLKQSHLYKRLDLLEKRDILEHQFPLWRISNGQYDFCGTLLKDSKLFELH